MVDFCDTAGQKRFHSLGSIYYKKADAAIIVFDRTDTKSLQDGFLALFGLHFIVIVVKI